MKKAVYHGSFDPITNGHADVIQKASKLFDELHVVVAINPSKNYMFTKEQRVKYIQQYIKDSGLTNVVVISYNGLVSEYAKNNDIEYEIRGLRFLSDFEAELQRAMIQDEIGHLQIVWMPPSQKYIATSSSVVREMLKFRGPISPFVPIDYSFMVDDYHENNKWKKSNSS